METRQIVVISGKTCSGKSELAHLLEKEFNFVVVSDRRASQDVAWNLSMDQPALIDRRRDLDDNQRAQWMLVETKEICADQKDDRPLVVDHLDTLKQVLQFRETFGANLVHVHLYASDKTLHERYEKRVEGRTNPAAYDELNQLRDPEEINSLKEGLK
ncbi:AAA family ATPase [Pseudomonas carnis]|uniref:AAA family ATPase n=1 Tax=Pseudomonas carnis TaxID=2487355 RepID=A0ABT5RP04_9PSED|nr:AAA family ATPase [Pseudomonas carnis]MDD1947725.1 AAA family ATPase [Pseudomonas carnis]